MAASLIFLELNKLTETKILEEVERIIMMCLPTYYSTGNNASPSYPQQPQPPRDDKYGGSSCLVGIMQLL